MTQIVAPSLASGASMAQMIANFLKFGASTVAVLNAAVEGAAASNPNLAASTVDRQNMRNNAKVGVFAAEAGLGAFVVTEGGTKGLQYVSASGLTATFAAGTAWVLQTSTSPDDVVRVTKTTSWTVLLTATSDNYVYIKSDASVGAAITTVGGSVPTLPADSLLLSVVTTNGTTVTGTPTDAAPSAAGTFPGNYRASSAWPVPSSATILTLPPCKFEVGGLAVNNTTTQSLDVTVSGNYASGTRANAPIYLIAANNGGSPKYALTMSAPSAAFLIGGATSGSTGRKQFRTIGSLAYRYLGLWPMQVGSNLKMGSRNNGWGILYSSIVLASGKTNTSFSALSFSSYVGSAGVVRTIRCVVNANRGVVFRETGLSVPGIGVSQGSGDFGLKELPINATGSLDYKLSQGGGLDHIAFYAWKEELD